MHETNYTLTPEEIEALIPALNNEIDAWQNADCGEHQAENDAWVGTLMRILGNLTTPRRREGILSDEELSTLAENNGCPSVADNLLLGMSQKDATAYLVGAEPHYDDGEGRFFIEYVHALHGYNLTNFNR